MSEEKKVDKKEKRDTGYATRKADEMSEAIIKSERFRVSNNKKYDLEKIRKDMKKKGKKVQIIPGIGKFHIDSENIDIPRRSLAKDIEAVKHG